MSSLVFLCFLVFWALAYNMGNFLSLGGVPDIFTILQKIEIRVLRWAAVMRMRKRGLHWIFQLSDRNRSLIEVEGILSSGRACVQAKEIPLLAKQLCFMLIFIGTLKSPITIVGNLDGVLGDPDHFLKLCTCNFC